MDNIIVNLIQNEEHKVEKPGIELAQIPENVIVYCEQKEDGEVAEISLELLSKGRKLAQQLNVKLDAVLLGYKLGKAFEKLSWFGVNRIFYADSKQLFPYRTLPHTKLIVNLFRLEQPQIALFGASSAGRDLAPRVASALKCGLTADCTSLEIGDHTDEKKGVSYKNLLYQIRPAFGGNIIATIINPQTRPQMATVREGVMKLEPTPTPNQPKLQAIDISQLTDIEEVIKIISRNIEKPKVNLKGAQIIVAGGYGMGSKSNFETLYAFAQTLGAEVGATRAAVDADFCEHERQIGQTGVTVRPKLYIACGISGSVQHRAGMEQSAKIISINTDPNAPLNAIADYVIIGDVMQILPKFIQYYKKHNK
ncbi:MAG: electron transfer flavoprotein subunit alpha/FixB family protein [Bacteroidales bacterium]|jgi:electron transfer flavoprotein alpha subunit|nr:electron transfer flavoprotein subunit alpha/FixB family protein [Bacteroidales bacterium]